MATKTKLPPPPTKFAGKAAVKRGQSGTGSGSAERGQARRVFLGNGLSRTAMLFNIAKVAGHRLTVPELNRIKDVNPRSLERVYDEVLRLGDPGNAMFALRLILK
jgi:hypothetical protein